MRIGKGNGWSGVVYSFLPEIEFEPIDSLSFRGKYALCASNSDVVMFGAESGRQLQRLPGHSMEVPPHTNPFMEI